MKTAILFAFVAVFCLALCAHFTDKHNIEAEVFWGVLAIFNYITASQSYLVAELKEKG